MDDFDFDLGVPDYGMPTIDLSDYLPPDQLVTAPDFSWENIPFDYEFGYDSSYNENYSNEGRNYPTPESTQPDGGLGGAPGSRTDLPFINLSGGSSSGSGGGGGIGNLLRNLLRPSSQGGIGGSGIGMLPILMAMMAMKSRPTPTGGGTTMGYAGPRQYNRQVVQSKYGPVVKYAQGGPVRMEDGGFVMTKKAVDGAGGPRGIQSLVPGARMIRGPGTGTSDDIPAVIIGKQGTTPAALSNGEAYVPKNTVQGMGGAQRLYSLMNDLQKRG